MGIVEEILGEFEAGRREYTIEYNEDGMIHFHIEHIRLDLDEDEFRELAETVIESRETLVELKNEI